MVRRAMVVILSMSLLAIVSSGRSQQQVLRHPDSALALLKRWEWARTEAKNRDFAGYWIGYSIQRLMPENSFIGTYFSDERRNHPSLSTVITGQEQVNTVPANPRSGDMTVMEGIMDLDAGENRHHEQVIKEVGILFHYTSGKGSTADEVKVSNLSLRVNLRNDPLIWLGGAGDAESIGLLKSEFAGEQSDQTRQRCVMAIGLHQSPDEIYPFLRDVLNGSGNADVRGDAAYWIGQLKGEDARNTLVKAAETDLSKEVREKAIFALSEMEGALDALISLAKKGPDRDVRSKAMFWLGQKASEKAVATLREIAYSEQETSLQKSALFALTQIPGNKGTDDLIQIAKTHPNPKVRKEAIFWLGQSEDPRALDVLVEIVKK